MKASSTSQLNRAAWVVSLICIIGAGIVSRTVHTGFSALDKYLGDALYAAMFYVIFRLAWPAAPPRKIAIGTTILMTALELFQLTLIPAQLLTSRHGMLRIAARLLGTEFHIADLAAYAAGIAPAWLADSFTSRLNRDAPGP